MVVDAFDTCRAGHLASSVSSLGGSGGRTLNFETVFACPDYDGDGSQFDDDFRVDARGNEIDDATGLDTDDDDGPDDSPSDDDQDQGYVTG